MFLPSYNFTALSWNDIPVEQKKGDTGFAYWRVQMMNETRVRMVEYSAGYDADHWCQKGHVLFCIEGEMETTLQDGRTFNLSKGSFYLVGDNNEPHRSRSKNGCTLLIVD